MTGPTTRTLALQSRRGRSAREGLRPGGWGRVLIGLAIVVLVVLFIYPPVLMVMAAFRRGVLAGQGRWTVAPFIETVADPATWIVVLNSFVLSVSVAIIGLILGTFMAWVAVRTTTPLRRIMTPVMAALLVIPPLFYGLGWYVTLNGTDSPVNIILHALFGTKGSPFGSGWATMILVLALKVIPIAYLFMIGPLSRMNSELDDAARMSGATSRAALFTVTLPLVRPTMFGVFVLMTTYGMSAYELPLLFGTPAKPSILVFSTKVVNSYTQSVGPEGWPNYAGAASVGLILVVLVIVLVLLRGLSLRGKGFTTISGKGFRPEPKNYGRIQGLFLAVFIIIVCLAGIIPLVQMVFGAFQHIAGVYSLGFTTDNFVEVLTSRRTSRIIVTSLWLAALAGFLAASVALLISWLAQRSGRALGFFAAVVSWAPVAIPGVLVGLALLTAYMPVPGLQKLIGTPILLILGFIVVEMPIASRAVEGGVLQISRELEESARISGASAATAFMTVVVPLVRTSFFSGWFIAAVGIAGNLALPVLLSSTNTRTAAVTAYDLYTQGATAQASALFVVLMGALVGVGALGWLFVLGITRVFSRFRLADVNQAMRLKGSAVNV